VDQRTCDLLGPGGRRRRAIIAGVDPRPLPGRGLGRRALLAGGVAGVAGAVGTALAGCTAANTGSASAQPAASPAGTSDDTAAVQRARAAAAGLAAAADRLAAADRDHAPLLGEVAADHRAHLAALGTFGAGAPSPVPSFRNGPHPQPADVVAAERDAARAALVDVQHASAPLAALLARIAGARAAHADLLAAAAGARTPGPLAPVVSATPQGASPRAVQPAVPAGPVAAPGTLELAPGAREAIFALTAGEHAAVFAYGLIAARVPPGRREQARAAWAWHLTRRDLLEERLLAAGVQPPVAAPGYDVGGVPTARGASRLAATVERRLGALAVRAVAATQGDDRREAAAGLVEGTRRLAAWTGRPETLPG
jgi:hypothetical protein